MRYPERKSQLQSERALRYAEEQQIERLRQVSNVDNKQRCVS
jgi:hypothetical protein